MKPIEDRFWSMVEPAPFEACWNWKRSVSAKGYGRFGISHPEGQRIHIAHRVAYELLIGEIPDGLQLDHLCRNPRCVNPYHLDPVTNQVNTQRGFIHRAQLKQAA